MDDEPLGPASYLGIGVTLGVLAAGLFALAITRDDPPTLLLLVTYAFAAAGSIVTLIGAVGVGVKVGIVSSGLRD